MRRLHEDVTSQAALFAERVLRRPLWPHQSEAAMASAFITVIAAARRTGKTELAETLALWTAFRERNVKVLILSATEDASRRLVESINDKLVRSPLTRGAVVDDFKTRIRLTNGSQIISLPASSRQVRGYGAGVRLVILDEASFMDNSLWQAAHYTALDERKRGARIVMCGTPWSVGFFKQAFERGQDGDPDYASFHWTYKANPDLDHAYLERQRDRVSPAEYAAEVLGEFSDQSGSLFPRSLLDRQTVPFELLRLDELAPPGRGVAGVDWGVSFDASAVAAVYRLPVAQLNEDAEWRPRFVALPYVWRPGVPLHEVVDAVAAQREAFAYISSETNGVGAMPTQELRRKLRGGRGTWNPVHTTNALKTAAYGTILALLEREQLFLPRDPALLRQLAGLRFEQGERGFTRIEAESAAVHDDVADALALAMLPYRPRRGGVACRLLSLASPVAPLPDADLGNFEGETFATPGGLNVWRKPPLQSVEGNGVSIPAGSPTTTGARRIGRLQIGGTNE